MSDIYSEYAIPPASAQLERYWALRSSIFPELQHGTVNDAAFTKETLCGAKLRVECDRILDEMEKHFPKETTVLVDVFGGSGALSIAAALRGWRVHYGDISADHTGLAKRNWEQTLHAIHVSDPEKAQALAHAIQFDTLPAMTLLEQASEQQGVHAVAYMDPPWGDSGYDKNDRSAPRKNGAVHFSHLNSTALSAIHCSMEEKIPFYISLPAGVTLGKMKPEKVIDGYRPDGSIAYHTFQFGVARDRAPKIVAQKDRQNGAEGYAASF